MAFDPRKARLVGLTVDGLSPPAQPAPEEQDSGPTFGESVKGALASGARALITGAQAPLDVIQGAVPTRAGQRLQETLRRGAKAADALKPEAVQAQDAQPIFSRGEDGSVEFDMPSPGQVTRTVIESAGYAPSLLVGAQGARSALTKLGASAGTTLEALSLGAANAATVGAGQREDTRAEARTIQADAGNTGVEGALAANEMADRAAGNTAALSFLTGAAGLGFASKLGHGSASRLGGAVKGVLADAPFEGVEEFGQQVIADTSVGRDPDYLQAAGAGVLGTLAGGLPGGIVGAIETPTGAEPAVSPGDAAAAQPSVVPSPVAPTPAPVEVSPGVVVDPADGPLSRGLSEAAQEGTLQSLQAKADAAARAQQAGEQGQPGQGGVAPSREGDAAPSGPLGALTGNLPTLEAEPIDGAAPLASSARGPVTIDASTGEIAPTPAAARTQRAAPAQQRTQEPTDAEIDAEVSKYAGGIMDSTRTLLLARKLGVAPARVVESKKRVRAVSATPTAQGATAPEPAAATPAAPTKAGGNDNGEGQGVLSTGKQESGQPVDADARRNAQGNGREEAPRRAGKRKGAAAPSAAQPVAATTATPAPAGAAVDARKRLESGGLAPTRGGGTVALERYGEDGYLVRKREGGTSSLLGDPKTPFTREQAIEAALKETPDAVQQQPGAAAGNQAVDVAGNSRGSAPSGNEAVEARAPAAPKEPAASAPAAPVAAQPAAPAAQPAAPAPSARKTGRDEPAPLSNTKDGKITAPRAEDVDPKFPRDTRDDRHWWDNELTGAGRRAVLKAAGLKHSERVLWNNLDPRWRPKVREAARKLRETDDSRNAISARSVIEASRPAHWRGDEARTRVILNAEIAAGRIQRADAEAAGRDLTKLAALIDAVDAKREAAEADRDTAEAGRLNAKATPSAPESNASGVSPQVESVQPGEKGSERLRADKRVKAYLSAKRPDANDVQRIIDYRTQALTAANKATDENADEDVQDFLSMEHEWAIDRLSELRPETNWLTMDTNPGVAPGELVQTVTLPVAKKGWKGAPIAQAKVYRAPDGMFAARGEVHGALGGGSADARGHYPTEKAATLAVLKEIERVSLSGKESLGRDSLNADERARLTKWLADERARLKGGSDNVQAARDLVAEFDSGESETLEVPDDLADALEELNIPAVTEVIDRFRAGASDNARSYGGGDTIDEGDADAFVAAVERALASLDEPAKPEAKPAAAPKPAKKQAAPAADAKPEPKADPTPPVKPAPSSNTLVTDDMAEAARKRLRSKLGGGQLNMFVDPTLLADGAILAVYHVERGARAFAAYAKAMIDDLGENAKPYLKAWYEAARRMPGAPQEGLSTTAEVDAADIDAAIDAKTGDENAVKAKASRKIADWIKGRLVTTKPITIQELQAQADREFGGTQAEGTYTSKDMYDALELGVNDYMGMFDPSGPNVDAAAEIAAIESVLAKIPTQTKRTAETDEFQQFSTPPPLAWLANWVSGVHKGDTMLEPSAGIGGLATFADAARANVVMNEFSPRRAAVLEQLKIGDVYRENAEQLNNVLPDKVKPTVVVMNPPFSSTAGRVQGSRSNANGQRHIEQALARLEPGGRLVAIVGEGLALDRPGARAWWDSIRAKYNLRANLGLDGNLYRKYGTTFDNQILVIDKTGPTTGEPVTGKVASLKDAIPLLEGIRNERANAAATASAQPAAGKPAGAGAPAIGKAAGAEGSTASSDATGARAGSRGARSGAARAGSGGARPGKRAGDGGRPAAGVQAPDRGAGRGGDGGAGRPVGNDGESGVGAANSSDREPRGVTLKPRTETTAQAEVNADSIFEGYHPQRMAVEGAKPHPGKLVQSAAMAAVEPPAPSYVPDLPASLVRDGLLSEAQLETVIYAGQAHEQTLAEGERRGFFIGDGTGVGKGREISGIILDNWRQGRRKAVWISEKPGLLEDARRDYAGVGGNPRAITLQSKTKAGDKLPTGDGIIFTTYSTLRSGENKTRTEGSKAAKSRLDQLVEALGEDFDGVIAFDEAHNMGNAVAMKGKRGMTEPSAQALAGVELQRRLPKARVVYVSATGATEVSNLSYAVRLGLWGPGTAFPSVQHFINEIAKGGLAAMELVSRDMKQLGLYTARSLSFDGVTYDRIQHDLTDFQTAQYNRLAEAWQVVLRNVHEALEETGVTGGKAVNGRAKEAALSAFWSTQQRFFNQVLTAMQMPSVLAQVQKDLDAGHSVVLQLVNTNEAALNRALAALDEEATLEDLDLTPRDTLIQYVQTSFPVQQFEEADDGNGNIISRPVVDAAGNPVFNKDAIAARDALLEDLKNIKVPDGPLEMLMDQIGVENIAEVTGRRTRVVRRPDEKTGERVRVKESRSPNHAAADAADFQAGKKRVLVFSDAGGTGYSFHADRTKENQQRRMHYLVQAGWRADKAVQGFGRTHRSNQASEPHYRLATTNLPAHKRFISTIARRLDQLGALTKGQRDAASQGMMTAADNLEGPYATDAVTRFFNDLYHGRVEGMPFVETTRELGFDNMVDKDGGLNTSKIPTVPQFLNRLLSLTTTRQDAVFQQFVVRMEAGIQAAIQAGTLDTGMQTVKAQSIRTVTEQTVFNDPKTNTETKYVELELTQPNVLAPFPRPNRHTPWRYYRSVASGKVWAVRDVGTHTDKQGRIVDRVSMQSPTTARSENKAKIEDEGKFEPIEEAEARELWKRDTDAAPKTFTETLHMVTGSLLPIWDRLVGRVSVVRAITEDGRNYLGRTIHKMDLKETLKRLGASASASKMTPAELSKAVLGGEAMGLANGWTLEKKRVANEWRIELGGFNYWDTAVMNELTRMGAIVERIQWQQRVFVPVGEKGEAMLAQMLQRAPVAGPIHSDHVEFSKAGRARTARGVNPASLAETIRGVVASWANAPAVRVVATAADLPAYIRAAKGFDASVEAVHDRGAIYLVADRFDSVDRALAVLAHEAIGHYAMETMLGPTAFAEVLAQVNRLRDSGAMPEIFAEVARRYGAVDGATFAAETIAVMAEKGVRNTIMGRVLAAMRAFLRQLGFKLEFSDTDLRAMIAQAGKWLAHGRAKPSIAVQSAPSFSEQNDESGIEVEEIPFDEAWFPSAVAQPALNVVDDARKQWEEKRTESPYFKAWFGNSKLKTKTGTPRVLFHGTDATFWTFREKAPNASGLPASGLGIFTSTEEGIAENYGERVMTLYGRAENPYVMSQKEVSAFESVRESAARQLELIAQGYDSVYIPDMATWVFFKANQLKSAKLNQGTFSGTNNDIRFSKMPPDEALANIEGAQRSALGAVADAIKGKLEDWKPALLGALTLRQLAEIGARYLPQVRSYADTVQRMQTRRNLLQQEAAAIATKWEKWQRRNRAQAEVLAGVMHDATIAGVDPAEEFVPGSVRVGFDTIPLTEDAVAAAVKDLRQKIRGAPPRIQTLLRADVARLEEALAMEAGRRNAYPGLRARWNTLPTDAQTIYKEARNAYAKRADQTLAALLARIGNLQIAEIEKKALADRMRAHFESQRVAAPYFPLARFGDYWISAERNGVVEFHMAENARDWKAQLTKLRIDGYTIRAQGKKIDTARAVDGASSSFMGAINEVMAEAGVKEDVRDEIYQIYLRTLPDLSQRKHFIHRKKVAGYSADALRAFAGNMNHTAHQLARLEHQQPMQDAMESMREAARAASAGDPDEAARSANLYNEMLKRHEWVMNPRDAGWVQAVSSANFVYYLGVSPAAALVNLTQSAITTFPALAARHGWAKALAEITRATAASARNLGNIGKTLSGDELKAWQELEAMGAIDKTQSHNLAGIAENDTLSYNPTWHRVMGLTSGLFHKAEVINREGAGLAAYRLARAAGQSHDAAVQYAADTIYQTHFDYSNANRARFMQGNAAKILFAFKQYSQNMTYFLWRAFYQSVKGATPAERREARRKLAGTLGMTAVFSGVLGLPLMTLSFQIANALNAIFGDDDEPWDAETEFRNFLVDFLGDGVGRAAQVGAVQALTGVGIADRVKLDQLWFRPPEQELEGRALADYWLEQAAGPVGGMFVTAMRGGSMIHEGLEAGDPGYLWRGVETMMPKQVKDAMRTMRYAHEGVNSLRGDPLVADIGVAEMALQMVGFSPARVAESYEVNASLKDYERQILDRRQALMDAYALSFRMRDNEAIRETILKIVKFNRSNPEIAIRQNTLRRSLQARQKFSERAIDGIVLNPKIDRRVRDAVRFGNE